MLRIKGGSILIMDARKTACRILIRLIVIDVEDWNMISIIL